jgi:osmotically-inducible protein OsmY
MKTDGQLQHDVMEELKFEPKIDHAHIGVSAKDGVVTLTGFVPNYAQKLAAERATHRVEGVKAVAQDMVVRFPNDPKTSDGEIANRILNVMRWNVDAPHDLEVTVDRGIVTLAGTVPWHHQRQEADKIVGGIAGVKAVVNQIQVQPQVLPGDVRGQIMSAFQRSSVVDANAIKVAVKDRTVELSGTVRAWNERKVAEDAAWSVPGVTKVVDKIILA